MDVARFDILIRRILLEVVVVVRCSLLIVFAFSLIGVFGLCSELPQVLPPNTTAYSAAEVAAIRQGITTLEGILRDYDYGSRRTFAANEWQSRNFAEYTAGILSERGYETRIVSQAGWPDGLHVWVLVGIPLGAKIAWVPVEASPDAGHSQQTLGTIPTTTDGSGNLWFDVRYLNFSEATELPANLPPVAKIRPPSSALTEDDNTKFLALGSSDPDGEIVLYQWDFGDGKSEVSTHWLVYHRFKKQGTHTVALTVIDNRGKSASATFTAKVGAPVATRQSVSGRSGCGCGN